MILSIKALCVVDNGNGTFTIEMESRQITPEQQKTFDQLFPNLQERVWGLLNQEALLASIATPSEVIAPKKNSKGKSFEAVAVTNNR